MPLEPSLTSSEKKELESLPEAPRLPPTASTKANVAPPQEHTRDAITKTLPTTTPAPASSGESYEIVESPMQPASKSGPGAKHSKSFAEVKPRVGGAGQTRKSAASVPSLPYPASSVSCPELPKFPIELQKKTARNGPRSHGLRSVPSTLPENEAESDPEEYYENLGLRVDLVAGASRPEGAQAVGEGLVNSAADLNDVEDDDPQEEYYNQDAINEIRAKGRIPNRSNIRSKKQAQAELYINTQGGDGRNSHGDLGDDDDQPVYGNEIADEPNKDNPYENISFPPPKSS